MNDHFYFLEAIRNADEDDDAASLIFADWLEEQGDLERAELIRVQTALAGMGDRGPENEERGDRNWEELAPSLDDVAWEDVADPGRFAALKHRERALLVNAAKWREPSQSWRLEWGPFQRGFVRSARVRWSDPSDFHVLQLLRNTAVVSLEIDRFESGPLTLEAARSFAKALRRYEIGPLRHLRIMNMIVEPGAIKALADSSRLAGLRRFSLAAWDRQDLSAEVTALVKGPSWAQSLRAMRLPANDTTLEVLVRCRPLPGLRQVSLRGSSRIDLLASVMQALPDVQDWRLRLEAPDSAAAALGRTLRTPNVTSLRFRAYSHIGPDGAEALASCPGLAELRTLRLGSNPIGDDGLKALARSPYLAKLRTLDIHRSQIGGEGAMALFTSPIAMSLASLKLGDNPMLNDAAEVWRTWSPDAKLRGLDVSQGHGRAVPLSKAGLAALAESPVGVDLLFLSLKRQLVQDDGAAILARAFADRGLLGLDLDGAEVTDLGRRTLLSQLSDRRLIDLRTGSER